MKPIDPGVLAQLSALTPRKPQEEPKLSRFQRMNLETQMGELQTNFATVTKRIQALDIDIGRALSAADRQVLEERKAERVAERDGIVQKIAAIEDQLGTD